MRWPRSVLATMAILASSAGLSPSAVAAPETPGPLFAATDTLHLTIRAPFDTLENTDGRSRKPVAGMLAVAGAAPETLAVQLSTRGITRGKREVCPFPPLRVDFAQPPGPGSLFAGQKSLKLVTHCRPDAAFQHHLLLEYAAYGLYRTLTPQSFGVRLASIDYLSVGGGKVASRYGFFIEDVRDVARRNGLKHLKIRNRIAPGVLDAKGAARFAMFQYMIGNLDWAMTAGPAGTDCCHNARLIAAKDAATGLTPVPYDFDFSGLVDAPYASPPEGIHLANIRVRLYRGYCRHDAEARAAAGDLLAQRAALTGVVDAVPALSPSMRARSAQYLAGFFDSVATPAKVDAVLKTCLR